MAFVVIAAAGITGSAWLLVLGFAAHGLKDAWQTTGPVCVRHPVVASVLRRCRLGRRSGHRDRDRRGDSIPALAIAEPRSGIT
jgi:hypothetical protein